MFKISEFFAKLSFKIDTKGLDEFERRLRSLENRVMVFDKRLQGKFDQIQKGLAKTQLAEKRALDIEKKKLQIAAQTQRNNLAALRIKEKSIQADKKQNSLISRHPFGPDRSTMHKLKDRAWIRGMNTGMVFGPDRSSLLRLRDKFEVEQAKEKASIERQTIRDRLSAVTRELQAARQKAAIERRSAKDFQKQMNAGMAFGPDRRTLLRLRDNFEERQARDARRRPTGTARGAAFGAGLGSSAMSWGRGFIPGLGGAWALSHLNSYSQELQGQQLALQAVTGSPEAAERTRRWLYGTSYKYGFAAPDVMPSFTKTLASFQGAGMNEPDARKTFEGTIAYTRTMGLSSEATKRVMLAVEQIANKTTVTMEELKRQMGDALPGVMSAMAEAVTAQTGKTTTPADLIKLIEGGDVPASVLPYFGDVLMGRAKSGGGLEAAMKTSLAEQNRFKTDWGLFVRLLGLSGMDEGMAGLFRGMSNILRDSGPLVEEMGITFKKLGEALENWSNQNPFAGLQEFFSGIRGLTETLHHLSKGDYGKAWSSLKKVGQEGFSIDYKTEARRRMVHAFGEEAVILGEYSRGERVIPFEQRTVEHLLSDILNKQQNSSIKVDVNSPINITGVSDPVLVSERVRQDFNTMFDEALIGFPAKGS